VKKKPKSLIRKKIRKPAKLLFKAEKSKPANLPAIRLEDNKAIVPDVSKLERLAKFLHQSGLFPDVKNIAEAITKIEYGREIGLLPVQSLSTIWIIKGMPCVKTQVMIALALRRGIKFKILKSDETICQIEFSRKDFEPHIETFTIDDAKRLKYTDKTAYVQQPKIMNRYRCFSNGLRIYAPDLTLGLYSKEEIEIGDIIDVRLQDEAEPKKDEGEKQKAAEEQKDSLIEDIKYKVAKAGIEVNEFKKFLEVFQHEGTKETREFLGYKFGNLSFHEGKTEDLLLLKQNLAYAIDQFNKWQKEQASEPTPDSKEEIKL
jgi:hypothetical protein